MEESEWYKLRNDRANRLDDIILNSDSKTIAVHIKKFDDINGQVMAICAANILSRWCRKVVIYLPRNVSCKIVTWRGQMLNDVILKIMQSADPFGDFYIESDPNKFKSKDYNLTIGIPISNDHYWIDAHGWVAGFGFGVRKEELNVESNDTNIIGAVFATSCINAHIFSNYIGSSENIQSFEKWHSLFDFGISDSYYGLKNPNVKDLPDFGKIWQIGAGAVGSSFDFILSLMPIKGNIHIIDYDKIEIPNTSSSLIFTGNQAFEAIKKVDACLDILQYNKELISSGSPEMDYSQFIKEGNMDKQYPDLILCFANERNIWSTIQYNEPPIVLHATTSSNWGVNFGRHIPFKEWCIVCRFGIENYSPTPVCSKAVSKYKNQHEENLGILPFLSPAAAILVFAEMLKLSLYKNLNYPVNSNFIQLSMKSIPNLIPLIMQRSPETNCSICSDQDKLSYHKEYKKSKYYINRE